MGTTRSFWRDTPPAAKWALDAAALLAVVAVVPFVVMIAMVTMEQRLSPLTVIFGPMPGNPLILWLYFTVPPAIVQTASGLALRTPWPALRVAGSVGALILATAALAWLGAIVVLAVRWLMTGTLAGDFYDLLGMVFFGLPVLLIIAALNLRAAFLAMRDLAGHAPHPRPA